MFDNYDLYQKRLQTYDTISEDKLIQDKIRTMKSALARGYNREMVEMEGNNFKCLISGINTQPKTEKKSFSTLVENGCEVGSIVYWIRNNSRWIITDREETEKAIFQGYISEALYEIKWKDLETDIVYSEWACVKGPEETTIPTGHKLGIQYDSPNQSLALIMPKKSKGISLLQRYVELMVNGRKWRIESIDNYSYAGLITLQLIEVLIDNDRDTIDIPNGQITQEFKIKTELDGVSEILIDSNIILNPVIYKNGIEMKIPYEINCSNALCQNNEIIFNTQGESIIIINYPSIEKSFIFTITVNTLVENTYEIISIIGDDITKTMTTNLYDIIHINNGLTIPFEKTGKWIVDSNFASIISETNSSIKIKTKNKIGEFIISYRTDEGQEYSKKIKIISIFGRS